METIIANLLSTWRYETRNGRQYLVVPMSILVPGVLNGSNGALFYPQEEVSKQPTIWNGMPLVLGHPQVNGIYVTARHPDILEKYGLGYNYNTLYNNKLASEAWVDVVDANRVDPRVVEYVTQNKKVDVSTGLFTENELAAEGANWNGTPYKFKAKNYRPDHIAILLDATGACSVAHGCGLNVNQEPNATDKKTFWMKLGEWFGVPPEAIPVNTVNTQDPPQGDTDVNKTQLVDWLVANCDCWKGANDKTILNTMDEAKLKLLKDAEEKAKQQQAVVNAATAGFNSGQMVKFNPTTGKWEEAASPSVTANQGTATTTQATAPAQPALTPEQIEDLTYARNAKNQQKVELIKRLVANVADDQKVARAEKLQTKTLNELEELVSYLPQQINPIDFYARPTYAGAAGGAQTTQTTNSADHDDILPSVYNEESEAA